MDKKLQKLIDDANKQVEQAKTPDEMYSALQKVEAVKSVVNAYLFNALEMEMLS